MQINYKIRKTGGLLLIIGAFLQTQIHAAGSETSELSQRIASAIRDAESGNYSNASTTIAGLLSMTRERAGKKNPPDSLRTAYGVAEDRAGALTWHEKGRKSYESKDWEGALYAFTAAQFGMVRLEMKVPAGEVNDTCEMSGSRDCNPRRLCCIGPRGQRWRLDTTIRRCLFLGRNWNSFPR